MFSWFKYTKKLGNMLGFFFLGGVGNWWWVGKEAAVLERGTGFVNQAVVLERGTGFVNRGAILERLTGFVNRRRFWKEVAVS